MRTLLLLRGTPAGGKAQPMTSKILKTNGDWVLMKDIKIGDEIFDGLGKPTKVIGVYPQGLKDVYELTTYDNRKCLASAEHLWKVRSTKQRFKYNHTSSLEKYFKVCTTQDLILDMNKEIIKKRLNIPVPKKLEYPKKDLKIPPYLLGALLGDGCLCQYPKLSFSNTEIDIIQKVNNLIEETYPNLTLTKNKSTQCQYMVQYKKDYKSVNNKKILKDLEYYGLLGTKSHNKFIPNEYLVGNIEQRMELLKGLMDTDGNTFEGSYSISTVSKQLMKDLICLGRSLGYIITVHTQVREEKYKNSKYLYNVRFQTNDIIVSSKKHINKLTYINKKSYSHIHFKAINYVGKLECQCIKVDSQDETYITDDFIVTHNTTWVKENNLEPYTLEADKFRTLLNNPIVTEDSFAISQKNDSQAWSLLFQCLEERMKRGDFTVIDATHASVQMINKYKALCEQYKYTVYVKEMTTSLEEALERNRKRDKYKFVPEQVIKKIYNIIQSIPLPSWTKKVEGINDILNFYTENVDRYNQVKIIGDVHGCYTVLKDNLLPLKEDILYIFLGDYFDRGIENKDMLHFLLLLKDKPNVILLEGNHESHWINYARNLLPKNHKFNKTTKLEFEEGLSDTQVEDLKKSLRKLYKKLRQIYCFEYNGQKYLCNHGGISYVPSLTLISTNEFIKGIGTYETEIDKIYSENYKLGECQNFIQFHGHRYTESTEHSICLEDGVEFGGNLCVATINNKQITIDKFTNEVYNKTYLEQRVLQEKEQKGMSLTNNNEVNKLIVSRLVKVKKVDPNLYSLNFTKNVFHKKLWNDISIKTRGLFVDRNTGEVIIRSYDKFFNFKEHKTTSLEYLKDNLQYPLNVWEKENGYLGLITVHNNEFIFATKSTTNKDSEYVQDLKRLFDLVDEEVKKDIYSLCKLKKCTFIFEVISKNDPHIIEYKDEKLVLLDIVYNSLETKFYEKDMKRFCDNKVIFHKKLDAVIDTFEHLHEYIEENMDRKDVEGVVITDKNNFHFKLKFDFYNKWKRYRNILNLYKNNINQSFPYGRCSTDKEVFFAKFLSTLDKDFVLNSNIIEIRRKYYEDK